MDNAKVTSHTEDSNLHDNPVEEKTNIEEGTSGKQSTDLESFGLENVEGYDYRVSLNEFEKLVEEEAYQNMGDEDSSEGFITKEFKIIDEFRQIPNAWIGSYSTVTKEVVINKDDRIRINAIKSYPWRAICSLLIEAKNGNYYIGTGWFVSPRTIITAGHCVYLHNSGGWAKSIQVMPGRNGSSKPFGTISTSSFRSVKGWTKDKGRSFDYGAIILPENRKTGNKTGFFGFCNLSDDSLRKKFINISGYPGDKPSGTQWYHGRGIKNITSRTLIYDVDTAGGQSGSPVWYKSNGKRYVVGIHTNGSSSGNSATRINKSVFENIKRWKSLGM